MALNGRVWRRKRPRGRPKNVLPSTFLLGGSIEDPLNLSSLQDEETNKRMNAVTPRVSPPLPTPPHRYEKIKVPQLDPTDPLQLLSGGCSKKKKKRKRKAQPPVGGPNAKVAKLMEMPQVDCTGRRKRKTSIKAHFAFSEIVSPAAPQSGTERKRKITAASIAAVVEKKYSSDYRYGNYDRYYFYRDKIYGPGDPRIRLLNPEMFEGKDVLDIGCNSGELTIVMALFGAKSVVGLDIDADLIKQATKNQRLFLKGKRCIALDESKELELRASNPTLTNVTFVSGNYVLKEDSMVNKEKQKFDVITCLRVTKWIQLNYGDAGLKRSFRRMFAQLRPGGVLYLETQPLSSYARKKNINIQTLENYKEMQLYPNSFFEFLLQDVGFSALTVISTPSHINNHGSYNTKIYKLTKDEWAVSRHTI
ncbi:7SK snRNA methylphosphate capping enzyme-like [Cloeon dipterum]|uniref:7SK snRNA methylphosphate capping enzyme-like n=1 Tax=Cloeon dipterum TaxID=197152 RepID=UPI00321F9AA6